MASKKNAGYLAPGEEEWRKSYEEHPPPGKKAARCVRVDDRRNCHDVGAYLEKICPELRGGALATHT